mgnify:CR=1 FL=1
MKHAYRRIMALLLASILLIGTALTAEAASREQERQELREKNASILQKLYQENPEAQSAVENSYGYAVLHNTGIKVGIFGSAHGRGIAVNNRTGKEVFMKMEEQSAGLGLGVKEYALVFVMEDEGAWNAFASGDGWKGGTEAGAAATDGYAGGGVAGASFVSRGLWVYQITTKGIALEASIKGTKFYPNKKLNDYSKD